MLFRKRVFYSISIAKPHTFNGERAGMHAPLNKSTLGENICPIQKYPEAKAEL